MLNYYDEIFLRENNLLDDRLFISQITPLEIIEQIESFFSNKSKCMANV